MSKISNSNARFGTAPVFFAAISTILGAVLFLRFGYAVGHVGFYGTFIIILIGHIVTIPTSMAIAEIATNQKVEGGGVYYIISRSFGINIGATIGVALFLSQAISVAFYIIAFAESFDPVLEFLRHQYDINITDKRFISIPASLLLIIIIIFKGANLGVKALYVVVSVLFVSLLMFFWGNSSVETNLSITGLGNTISNPDNFFYVFAIIFPAFTGMAAGVGLSGDLKDPKRSIPIGTLAATIAGMLIYMFVAFRLAITLTPEQLVSDQLIMGEISLWAPVIPIGLALATISSALGSILVAPRTLQALAEDKVFVNEKMNKWVGLMLPNGEPVNATIITSVIALFFVAIGDVDFVAEIISMFFMVTYGAICTISFLNHFAGDPSYRPAFKSRWYISLIGAVACLFLMFSMKPGYAFMSLLLMVVVYILITKSSKVNQGLTRIFQGVIFQLSRKLQVYIQKTDKDVDHHWRPSIICISEDLFTRPSAFQLIRWISHKYGFGTYIHYYNGYLSKESIANTQKIHEELIQLTHNTKSNVYVDTMISPSYTSAIAQAIQMPSISGAEFNMILFEYERANVDAIRQITENFAMVRAAGLDVAVLSTTVKEFGFKKKIDIWITPNDVENGNLMILMGYIIIGHPEWQAAQINIFAAFPKEESVGQIKKLTDLIKGGRLPISDKNIQAIEWDESKELKQIICEQSKNADLTMVGFRAEVLKQRGVDLFNGFEDVGNVLFINAMGRKHIE